MKDVHPGMNSFDDSIIYCFSHPGLFIIAMALSPGEIARGNHIVKTPRSLRAAALLYRKFANAVMIAALKKSMNREPTSGTIMKATGAGP